jgi:multiple RNA-binding domain-containing protein 1
MAFVGFKTDADATKALDYFNGTFVDTSRIAVEYARAVKSSKLERPWWGGDAQVEEPRCL